jgi:hypothetical protein
VFEYALPSRNASGEGFYLRDTKLLHDLLEQLALGAEVALPGFQSRMNRYAVRAAVVMRRA